LICPYCPDEFMKGRKTAFAPCFGAIIGRGVLGHIRLKNIMLDRSRII